MGGGVVMAYRLGYGVSCDPKGHWCTGGGKLSCLNVKVIELLETISHGWWFVMLNSSFKARCSF
jgi:hypothetical protein